MHKKESIGSLQSTVCAVSAAGKFERKHFQVFVLVCIRLEQMIFRIRFGKRS